MKNPNSNEGPDINFVDLVVALNELRDALVNVSLKLKDYQFDFDSISRDAAIELADEVLGKAKVSD